MQADLTPDQARRFADIRRSRIEALTPRQLSKRLSIRISPEEDAMVRDVALSRGVSVGEIVRLALASEGPNPLQRTAVEPLFNPDEISLISDMPRTAESVRKLWALLKRATSRWVAGASAVKDLIAEGKEASE